MTSDATADDSLFETALGVPGVLAVLVDARVPTVHVVATTGVAAELARAALKPWACT